MITSVNLNVEKTEQGNSYVTVYQVFGVNSNDECVLIHMYFNESEALDAKDYFENKFNGLYLLTYVKPVLVWLCHEV